MQGAIIKGNKKIINAWATYDLANSVYNLVITATIFPIYYNIVTSTRDAAGNVISSDVSFLGVMVKNTALYDWAIAAAYLLVSIIIPILSGIADYGGSKKLFMRVFSMLGATACSLMYFFDSSNLFFGLLMAILACIGFAGSLVFYNAYLPEIAAPEEQDRVSAKGFAMGAQYDGAQFIVLAQLTKGFCELGNDVIVEGVAHIGARQRDGVHTALGRNFQCCCHALGACSDKRK